MKNRFFLRKPASGHVFLSMLSAVLLIVESVSQAWAQSSWEKEWKQVQAAGRQEGKIVLAIPPSAELRKALEVAFKQRFGIEIEFTLATSAKVVKRIADEYQAGVRSFDVIISTWDNLEHTLLPKGLVEPLASYWILPEVRDPKTGGVDTYGRITRNALPMHRWPICWTTSGTMPPW